MGKSFFGSKTVWANVGVGILAVLGANIPGLSFLNDPAVMTAIATGVNVLMRLITKDPITSIVPK